MNYYLKAGDLEKLSLFVSAEEFLLYRQKIIDNTNNAIDVLTYSRIPAVGFWNLTPFQQKIINECAYEIACFLLENREILDTPLTSYSINGVSMQFQFNQAIYSGNGVVIPKVTYKKLMSTGLCYGGL